MPSGDVTQPKLLSTATTHVTVHSCVLAQVPTSNFISTTSSLATAELLPFPEPAADPLLIQQAPGHGCKPAATPWCHSWVAVVSHTAQAGSTLGAGGPGFSSMRVLVIAQQLSPQTPEKLYYSQPSPVFID